MEGPSVWLVDEVVESLVCWREACEDVRDAYAFWGRCREAQAGLAYAGYRAALDREDHAAHVFAMWADRLRAAAR